MYKVVIGLEVHCELDTLAKNFSQAKNTYTSTPNINVGTVDLGLPGILPVPNKEAVKKALKTAMALNCKTPDVVIFDRKNYFYPDLPKGYQITQMTKPMGKGGYLNVFVNDEIKKVEIHQLHLEEDTASLEHASAYSLIDYNRSGIPLMEIVTEPCIHSADEAVAFLETLRNVFLYLGVSEAKSDKGQMRCDVNVSLMKEDAKELGTKVEMKNINSFSNVRAAIEYEIIRQTEILESGNEVIQETRRINPDDLKTYTMREKVDAVDYKYFIEPNIPPVKLTDEYKEEVRSEIPELEFDRINKYITEYKLSKYDATVLAKDKLIADYFEEVIKVGASVLESATWVNTVVLGTLNKLEITLEDFFITPTMLGEVIVLVDNNKLSQNAAKKIVYRAIKENVDPLEIIKSEGLEQIDDEDELKTIIKEVVDQSPDVLKQYIEEGKDYVINFFVGGVMKRTKGQANPNVTKDLIKEELESRR